MGASCGKVSPEDRDREALTSIFKSCGGAIPVPGWKRQRFWCSDRQLFLWDGVTCDKNTGRVTKLELKNNNLYGQLPLNISFLTYLQELDVSSNKLVGRIPESLLELEHLKVVRFVGNEGLQSVVHFKESMAERHPTVEVFVDIPPPEETEEEGEEGVEKSQEVTTDVSDANATSTNSEA